MGRLGVVVVAQDIVLGHEPRRLTDIVIVLSMGVPASTAAAVREEAEVSREMVSEDQQARVYQTTRDKTRVVVNQPLKLLTVQALALTGVELG